MLWEPVRLRAKALGIKGVLPHDALQIAATEILAEQVDRVSIPKRFSYPMREIWQLQPRFLQRNGKRPQRLMTHLRFRAAYDFFLLRAEAGEADQAEAAWWKLFVEKGVQEVERPAAEEKTSKGRRRRRRRPKKPTVPND